MVPASDPPQVASAPPPNLPPYGTPARAKALHKLARQALDDIYNRESQAPVNLNGVFPWEAYVAEHSDSATIIGPGITHAEAVFLSNTCDANRGGAPRLVFRFFRGNKTFCQVRPGRKPQEDAQLIIYDI